MVRLSLVSALLSLGGADALSDRLLPRETVKLMVDAFGMSPLPTTPPLVPRGLPKELAKRASRTAIDFPAPGYYCGLVNGDINNLLTCAYAGANCVQYGTAVGCCASSNLQQCTDIATECLNWEDECDSSCSNNPRVTRCAETTRPYCGTYFFGDGKRLFGCRASLGVTSQVIPMSEYFSSRYGPNYQTMLSGLTSDASLSISIGTATESLSGTSSSSNLNPTQSLDSGGESENDKDDDGEHHKKKKLSGGAIGGIIVGSIVGVGAIAGLIILFCVRKKKGNAAPQGPPPTAPLMHEQQVPHYGGPPPVVGAGYYQPEQKPAGVGEAPPYSPGYPPHMHHPVPPPVPAEIGGSPVHNPLQAQSQPLLGQSAEYYNQNRGSYIQPVSPHAGSINSPPPPGTSPPPQAVSPHQLSATHAGPVPENIYEMPGAAGAR
ncbi:conserved hypothetical protein [Histoplasma capsulatum var. duboisii H88]|uniref:Uncharacterized protein n=1 Tax=Ajellomyces capsulatus (strain H88) TaxID=544711 RepID=F0UJV9_AJEC8|nr:conserved hypothetical protein [Histoplasma capsulatum var. duboisii H88]QSS57275.1 hypothetical protein I7I53_05706 [Histoplasma capsulatum var. duboisii H88]